MKRSFKLIALMLCFLIIIGATFPTFATIEDKDTILVASGITIKNNTKLQDVINRYGQQPKIVTSSVFGGTANTFYKNGYEDLLYIETNEEGIVMSAGSCSKDFKSSLSNYGDPYNGRVSFMQGYTLDDWDEGAIGVIVYNNAIRNYSESKKLMDKWYNNQYEYEKNLCQHTIPIVNCFLIRDGDNTIEFNNDLYDALAKIEQNGKKLLTYAEENNKEDLYKIVGTETGYLATYEALPNPFRAADGASGYRATETKKYGYFKYHLVKSDTGTNGYDAKIEKYYVSKELIEKGGEEVPLTEEENKKYEAAKAMYMKSIEEFNKNGSDVYEIEPQYKEVPLVAGKIYENKLKGTVYYLNAIRVAAGIPTVKYNETLSNRAQHKSVLVVYVNNFTDLEVPSPHYPPKPDEVSQEFYDVAMNNMGAENLYGGSIINGINNAINDGYGDPITCGHRYNLLEPYWSDCGIGEAAGQSTHRFGGSQSYTNEIVAWPSAGITPTEAYAGGYWTCNFYKNYSVTSNTTVEIIRLNDNKKWEFVNKTTQGTNRFAVNGNLLSFYNQDLTGKEGNVYKFIIHNVKNTSTGEITDYTYRTVFKSLYGTEKKILKYPESLSLDKTSITLGKGQQVDLNTIFKGKDVTEICVNFSSSAKDVATVSQYGTIKGLKEGKATITATTLNGKTATCTVTVTKTGLLGDTDGNSKITTKDAKMVLQHIVKKIKLTEDQTVRADTSKDGKITTKDAKLILQYIVKKISSF